jgi:hypothetical protein
MRVPEYGEATTNPGLEEFTATLTPIMPSVYGVALHRSSHDNRYYMTCERDGGTFYTGIYGDCPEAIRDVLHGRARRALYDASAAEIVALATQLQHDRDAARTLLDQIVRESRFRDPKWGIISEAAEKLAGAARVVAMTSETLEAQQAKHHEMYQMCGRPMIWKDR